MACSNACPVLTDVNASHPRNVAAASARTTGTKIDETRSASCWTFAFDPCAAWSDRTISARVACSPLRVTKTTSRPCPLTEAPMTSSPGPTSTGTDSPVSRDRSTQDVPSFTTPSAGIFSPGRTDDAHPGPELVDPDGALGAVGVQHPGVRRGAREQRAGRVAGRHPGAGLEQAAHEDQRDDDRPGVEVVGHRRRRGHPAGHRRRREGRVHDRPEAVEVGGERPDGDERVHRRGAVPCRAARADEERPAPVPLDDASPSPRSAT